MEGLTELVKHALMESGLILPFGKQHWLMDFSKLGAEVVSCEGTVQRESLGEFYDVLNVQVLRVLLDMFFPEVNAIRATLI